MATHAVLTCSTRALLQDGRTPLHAAARHGDMQVVGLLLEAGAAVAATNVVRLHGRLACAALGCMTDWRAPH
jgi:ankyrin repeat protein